MYLVLPPFIYNNPEYMEIARSMYPGVEMVENKPIVNENAPKDVFIKITVK